MAFCGYDDSPTVTVERRRALAYVFGALFGLVWLWFWIKGHWFAALIAALALGAAWFVLPEWHAYPVWWMTLICFVAPWVPMMARPALRRVSNDLNAAFGSR